jgi:fatty acid desaturase
VSSAQRLDRAVAAELPSGSQVQVSRWPLERLLFAMAGVVTLLSAALAGLVSPWFLVLTAFVGLNQLVYVAVHDCPASVVLRRLGRTPRCRW